MVINDIEVARTGDMFKASCHRYSIHAFGGTEAKALIRLKLIMQFYLNTARELGYHQEDGEFLRYLARISAGIPGDAPADPRGLHFSNGFKQFLHPEQPAGAEFAPHLDSPAAEYDNAASRQIN